SPSAAWRRPSGAGAPRTWRTRRGARAARPSHGWSGAGSAAASPPSCSPAWAGHPTTAPSSTPSSCWHPPSCSAPRRRPRRGRPPSARAHGLPELNVPDLIGPVARRETTQHDPGVITETRLKEKLKRPPLYKVLFHNDDYTTMEFVVWALMSVFHHDEATATGILRHVHQNGIRVADR